MHSNSTHWIHSILSTYPAWRHRQAGIASILFALVLILLWSIPVHADGPIGFTDVWFDDVYDSTHSVAWGDMDGDGDLDLVVGNEYQANRIYRNEGGGTFTEVANALGSIARNTHSVAWGDMDGDGDLDLATGNIGVNRIYRNEGKGTFAEITGTLGFAAEHTYSIAWGDVDGDGDLDLAIGNGWNQVNRIYRNEGGETFTEIAGALGPTNEETQSVAWGDVDGDGDLDLAVGNYGQVNRIYRNEGGGTFNEITNALGSADEYTSDVAWGDVDGDGDLDLVIGNSGVNRIYRNEGRGTFNEIVGALGSADESTSSVAWGDMDGDGDLDLAVGNDGQVNRIYRNNGKGAFQEITDALSIVSERTSSVAWGDMDGDGDLDLAVGNGGAEIPQANRIYRTEAVGAFQEITNALGIVSESYSVAWGDMDGDNDLDLAVGNHGQVNRIYRNKGKGTFAEITGTLGSAAEHTNSVAWGDMDGDGDLDLAVGNGIYGAPQVNRIYRNEGGETFIEVADALSPTVDSTYSVAWGDMDGDGDLDLAVGNDGQVNRIYRNEGEGTFSEITDALGSAADSTHSVAWGDMDGDGDLDLAVGNSWNQVNRMYRNKGGETFSEIADALGPAIWHSEDVAWGDMDGDGDLDLAIGNSWNQVNRIYRNEGGGTFTQIAGALGSVSESTYSVAWGDMDGDGDLDLAVGSRIYRNEGGGTFNEIVGALGSATEPTLSVAWGDVDGDGDLDLAVGNYRKVNRIYRNLRYGFATVLPGNAPHVAVRQPTAQPAANFYAVSGYLDSQYISIPYTLFDPEGDLMGRIEATYSPDGGGRWLPAVATSDTVTMNLTTGRMVRTACAYSPTQTIPDDPGSALSVTLATTNAHQIADLDIWLSISHTQNADLEATLVSPNGITVTLFASGTLNGSNLSSTVFDDQANASILSGTAPYTLTYRPVGSLAALDDETIGGIWTLIVTDTQSNGVTGTLAAWGMRVKTPAVPHTYTWDTFASGFFGQSDNVVLRLKAHSQPPYASITNTYQYTHNVSGPYQWSYASATSSPFRVRGTQVRVYSETIHISNTVENALVYRLPKGQFTGGSPLADGSGTPFRTDHQGYLQGRGTVEISDTLFALLPITHTNSYTVYHTNATPTETGMRGHTVIQDGVQAITVTVEHPLILFNLDISLEWDARQDPTFLEQLEFDLKRTSEFLYDWTNGQAALGRLTLYHDREMWSEAHVRIYASNRLRPNAILGGIVSAVITDPLKSNITYAPGQVRMATVWNRYGESSGSLGEDWPRTLAHELGHYALFLDDAYLGLDEDGLLIPVNTCTGTAMADPYRDDYGEFHLDAGWLPACEDTLAQRTVGRSDWATIHALYPWLTSTTVLSGPTGLPLAVTQIQIVEPITPTTTLDVPIFYLSQDGAHVQPGLKARAILFQPSRDRMIDLGRATLDRVVARGARVGDRVCLYELAEERLGCEDVTPGDNQLVLFAHPGWRPDVIVTPFTSRTVNISMTVDSASAPLRARLYPLNGPASEEITLTPLTAGRYTGTFDNLDKPTVAAYVHIWVDEDEPRREIVTDYALGGNPVTLDSRDVTLDSRDVTLDSRDAPGMSSDGHATIFGATLVFTPGTFISLQAATILPDPPPWATVVGQGYRLLASIDAPSLDGTSLRFQYSGKDVPPGEEHLLKLYYWDGTEWHQLPTKLDAYSNTAVAPTQGEGLYVLMSSLEIPLYGPGWNNFAYPVQGTRPVAEALRSIEGYYNIVYGHVPTDTTDPWKVHGAGVPDWVNDLKVFRFGQGYWINVTQPITLLLRGNADLAARNGNSFPYPPATYYGPVSDKLGFAPAIGMTITAWINGNLCGQAQTQDIDGEIWFAIDVLADDWDQTTGCGAPGRTVTFGVETRGTIALTAQIYSAPWNNDRVWALPVAGPRVYLPLVIRDY